MVIQSHTKEYKVNICRDLTFLNSLFDEKNSFWVIDKKVYELYSEVFRCRDISNLFLLDAVEENKVIDTTLSVCDKISALGLKRNAVLISVGGGITQDITGFTANILYRGIRWIFVPTTLLAACDSCIGGKTSLNYKSYKNLLGTFYAPDMIYICSDFFNTLTRKDFESGLGEVVKFNLMSGEEGIAFLEKNIDSLLQRDQGILNLVIERSLDFKKQFIEKDEFDRGERVKLNFAHTFGHAIETVSHYQIPHGTAVAMGVIAANCVSAKRGWIDTRVATRMEKILLRIIHISPEFLAYTENEIIDAMHKDKKQVDEEITTVLMRGKNLELYIERQTGKEEIQYAIQYLFHVLKAEMNEL